MPLPPRVAFFPDSFHEVNGVAHTSRNFAAFAARCELPMLVVRAGEATRSLPPSQTAAADQTTTDQTSVHALELKRSRLSIRLEKDLEFDPLFARHLPRIRHALLGFRPDLIHITGPSELGIAGAFFAWRLGIPLAASWHTNVHEYAARRGAWLTRRLPPATAAALDRRIEAGALWATTRFYALARVLYAPNPELCTLLTKHTHRPCHLMQRGVDTILFTPARRTRPLSSEAGSGTPTTPPGGPDLVIGYVGRLSIEKNVAALPLVAAELRARGLHNIRFRIIGHGKEEPALRAAMPDAAFPGVLRGEALAVACADMDLLLFPSHTDTFGNVVLEALASGVPALVTAHGGPRHIVRDGETGIVIPEAETQGPREAAAFADAIAALARDPARLDRMRAAARVYALRCSWDAVFDAVYAGYADARHPLSQANG